MLKMLKHFRIREWVLVVLSIALIVLQVWLDLKMPEYMEEITKGLNSGQIDLNQIWVNGGMMLLLAFSSLASAVVVGFMMARIAASFSQRVRLEMFTKVNSFSNDEINRFTTASLITRTSNDVSQVQMFITMGVQLLFKAPILAVWAVIKILDKGTEWSIATGITLVLLTVLIAVVMLVVVPKFKKVQTLTDNLTSVTRESLMGVRIVRAYNAEDYQEAKFEKANTELTDVNLFTSRGMALMMPFMNLLMNLLSIAIFVIGAILIDKLSGNLEGQGETFASMVVFTQYAMQVVMAYMMLVMVFIFYPRANVSSKRIDEVLNTPSSITDGHLSNGEEGLSGEVEFRNVSFKYPDAEEYVLRDISFKAKQGETVAFIGSTGSGKSTLINLLPRFYDVTEGEVLLNNVNVKDYYLHDLYNKLGYVPQKAVLFKGTIATNVAYGESGLGEETDEDLWKALEIAQGKDFVEETEDKLEHEIAQAGTNLSGGQKQRVAIARAVAKKPEIYIFDDSFSALDYQTDRVLRTELKKESKGVTSLIVAQRIGTIIDADRIIVLDKGKMVGNGKHRELLKTCSVYKEIAMSQLSEEELA